MKRERQNPGWSRPPGSRSRFNQDLGPGQSPGRLVRPRSGPSFELESGFVVASAGVLVLASPPRLFQVEAPPPLDRGIPLPGHLRCALDQPFARLPPRLFVSCEGVAGPCFAPLRELRGAG